MHNSMADSLGQSNDIRDFDKVSDQQRIDGLGRMGHQHTALEGGLLEKERQGSSMVQVEVTDQEQVDRCWIIQLIKVRQALYASIRWMDTTIQLRI